MPRRRGNKTGKKKVVIEDWPSLAKVEGEKAYAGIWEIPDPEDPKEVIVLEKGAPLYHMVCGADGEDDEMAWFPSDGKLTLEMEDDDADSAARAKDVMMRALRSNPCRGPGQVPDRNVRCTIADFEADMEAGPSGLAADGRTGTGQWNWFNTAGERIRESDGAAAADSDADSDDEDNDGQEKVYSTPTFPINQLAISIGKDKDGNISVYSMPRIVRDKFSTPEKATEAMRLFLTMFSSNYFKEALGCKDTVFANGQQIITTAGTVIALPLPECPPSRDDEEVPEGCALFLEDIAEIHLKAPYGPDAYTFRKKHAVTADFYPPGFGYKAEDGETIFCDFIELLTWALAKVPEDSEKPDFDLDLVLDIQGYLVVRKISFLKKSSKGGKNANGTNISLKRMRIVRAIATDATFEVSGYTGAGAVGASTSTSKKKVADDTEDF